MGSGRRRVIVRSVSIRTTAGPTRFTAAATKLFGPIVALGAFCWAATCGGATLVFGESCPACEGDTRNVLTVRMTPKKSVSTCVLKERIDRVSFGNRILQTIQLAFIV